MPDYDQSGMEPKLKAAYELIHTGERATLCLERIPSASHQSARTRIFGRISLPQLWRRQSWGYQSYGAAPSSPVGKSKLKFPLEGVVNGRTLRALARVEAKLTRVKRRYLAVGQMQIDDYPNVDNLRCVGVNHAYREQAITKLLGFISIHNFDTRMVWES